MAAAKYILRYQKGTVGYGPLFPKGIDNSAATLEAFSDLDWSGGKVERKSTYDSGGGVYATIFYLKPNKDNNMRRRRGYLMVRGFIGSLKEVMCFTFFLLPNETKLIV